MKPLWNAVLFALGSSLAGCGALSTDFSAKLQVVMYGVFKEPPNAAGSDEPDSQTYTLKNVALVKSGGKTIDFYKKDPTEFTIINRSQILHEKALTDHDGQSISRVVMTFKEKVTGSYGDKEDLEATLTSSKLELLEPFTVDKKSKRIEVKVHWKNTILIPGEDGVETVSMGVPNFSFELKDD